MPLRLQFLAAWMGVWMCRWQQAMDFAPYYAELGVLAPEARVEAFCEAVERLVIPRLTRLGLDGQSAWHDRYAAV